MSKTLFGLLSTLLLVACQATSKPVSSASNVNAVAWSVDTAVAVLRVGIADLDPSVRAMAVSSWISSGHESRASLSPWVLADPSPYVQRAAAKAARTASLQLTIHPNTDAVARSWASSDGADPEWVKTVIDGIREGMFPADSELLDLIVEHTGSPLGPTLVEGVSRVEEPMQLPLAISAVRLNAKGAMESLKSVLSEADTTEQLIAIEALVESAGAQAKPWLEKASKRQDSAVGVHARLGLVALGARPLSVAVDALSAPDRDTRAWAARCLGFAGKDRSLPREVIVRLQSSVRDESPAVRYAAVWSLVHSIGVEFVPVPAPTSITEPDAVSLMVAGKWLTQDAVDAAP